jgi:hypothetical protein
MRFETSQTTPAFLDRRLQLRMLSFVGLIAIIMFTLSALNLRPASKQPEPQQRQAAVSPDSLVFEVRREERDLKPDEFVIPDSDDEGIRGQSPRDRADSTNQERELFVPRSKERTSKERTSKERTSKERSREDISEDQFFRRRKSTAKQIEQSNFSDDGLGSSDQVPFDQVPFDEDPGFRRQTVKEFDRIPTDVASRAEDDWNTDPLPTTVVEEREPIRRQPSPERSPTHRRDNSPTSLFDKTPEPYRPNRVETNETLTSRDEFDFNERDIAREKTPKHYPKKTPYGNEVDQDEELFDNQGRQPPIDLRRRDEFTRNYTTYDEQPTSDDIAPVRIDKRYLDVVKDNTIGVRRDEAEVFYWLLDHARRVPAAALQRAADREVQYINLMTEPDRYRGEPVSIEGDLFRLYEFEASRNKYGVTKVYEGWVFTGDSSHHPYRIVCTSLPNGIEPGENLRKPVRITGYFFKREGYRSNGGVHIAPTLLARRISINPLPNGIPLTSGILPYMTGAIMAIGLAMLVTIVGFAIGDGRASRAEMLRLQRHPQPSFVGIHLPETISVEESLQQLAERDRESAVGGAYGPLFSRQAALEHAVHDYSKSRQIINEETQRQHRKQTGALQSWASRKQAAQAEIDALREAQTERQTGSNELGDELDTDGLDPAQNVLVRSTEIEEPHRIQAAPHKNPILPTKFVRSEPSSHSTIRPTPASPHDLNHFAQETTRLSEYEDEIARMTSQQTDVRAINPFGDQESEKAIASQIVEDQFLFEQELRNQEQLAELKRESTADQHPTFDRADRETVSFSLPSSSSFDRPNHDKQADDSETYEGSDAPNGDLAIDNSDSNPVSGENSAEAKRNYRNRRDWRKGRTA